LGRDGTNPTLEGVSGLYRRSPGLAAMLLTSMFGLAGIPPTAGFAGKWFVFAAALQREHFWLVLIAAINGTIALYYYLRVVKAAYLDPPGDRAAVRVTLPYWTAGAVATALTIVVGVYPQPLWGLARRAAALLTRG
jgi:NADH-quinone oxidoreductase subunit N